MSAAANPLTTPAITAATARTVYVAGNPVTPTREPLPEQTYADVLQAFLGSGDTAAPLEAYSRDTKMLVAAPHADTSPNRFIAAAHAAYAGHYPLALSPDIIWLLIGQGFAIHVRQNAEALRSRFVAHEGQALITVERLDFIRGFEGNDWEGIVAEFSEQIRSHIGEATHSSLVPAFTTTGIVEKAAFEIALMDAMQSYFKYTVSIVCGIPYFVLEGTAKDWKSLRSHAACLQQYDLDWWIPHLLPVLDEFVAASEGEASPSFWENFYRVQSPEGCGWPVVNGHVLQFFPYLPTKDAVEEERLAAYSYARREAVQLELATIEDPDEYTKRLHLLRRDWEDAPTNVYERNDYLPDFQHRGFSECGGIDPAYFPSGLSIAPFTLVEKDNSASSMEFVAGFVGVAQDARTLLLRPEIGWAVRDKE